MKLTLPIIALLALTTLATCYRPPPPPPRYLPPPTQNHFRRPHPSSHSHQSAPRYPPRPRLPFPRQPIAPPPRFVPAPMQYKPVQHVVPHPYQLQQVDDNSGPIHTIPAPKLGPNDRPAHFNEDHGHSGHLDKIPQRIVTADPSIPAFFGGVQHEQHFLSHQQAYLDSNDVAGRTADGSHAYYAPDPDPSLPTKRIPPTFDPHSSPSNGRLPPVDLLPALNSAHQTLDSYGVPVVLHSFNYQEPYRRATNQAAVPVNAQGFYGQSNPSVEEAYFVANHRQDHVQEAVPNLRRTNEEAENISDGDTEKVAFFEKVDGPVYSVLPNQEVAETLATLAAAGNINSNIINKAKDVQEAEDYVEEEILKAGPLEKADDDREYITDEDKEVQLVFGTRIKQ